jgi:signal transduction histidine kinase
VSANPIKILLIEDNPADAILIRENLYDVTSDNDVAFNLIWKDCLSSGLDFLKQGDVDVVLLDLNLPDSVGFETFSRLQEKMAIKPIIVLTGVIDRELATRAVREGAQDYLIKGEVDGRLISRSIRYSIERKKSEVALRRAQSSLEQKVRDRTRELNERYVEMERLMYAVSHELMVPLVTIKGFLGFLKKDVACGNRLRIEIDLGLMGDAVERMEALLSKALELSSVGKLSKSREKVRFGDLVQEALGLASERIKSSGAEILLADDFPVASVDRARIGEVLSNLIENSIMYTAKGKLPRIEIGWRTIDDETVFFVKDEGVGMDPGSQRWAFDLSYKDKGEEPSGVGLALSKRIIEVHGGRMWIESEVNKGCTVYFTLPSI